jgi:hypothetical protein
MTLWVTLSTILSDLSVITLENFVNCIGWDIQYVKIITGLSGEPHYPHYIREDTFHDFLEITNRFQVFNFHCLWLVH